MAHVDDLLLPFVLGVLSEPQNNPVQVHLHTCARCSNMLSQAHDELAQLALSLPTVAPPALLRESLLHALGEVGRFTDQLSAVAAQLSLSRHDTELLFDELDIPANWTDSHSPGVQVYAVPHRPGACFIRVAPGHPVLPHPSVPQGAAWVLQGGCRDADGLTYGVTQQLNLQSDQEPEFVASPGPDLICLVLEPGAERSLPVAAQPRAASEGPGL